MKKTIIGTIIICIGVILLGNTLNIWDINLFFRGWWTLFIIIPSIIGLFEQNNFTNSLLSLFIGVLLLLASRHIISWSMVGKVFLPIFIILLGWIIIFGNFKKTKRAHENSKEYIAIFSGVDEEISEINTDFSIIAIFGSVDLDLRDAKLKEDVVIHAISIFGGVHLKLPTDVKVETTGVPIFGGIENKTKNKKDTKKVSIDYVTIFGGIDLI